jgi:hypothetical protein
MGLRQTSHRSFFVPIVLNFVEIIVRKGNMIYIPFNWFYFIYKGNNEECVIVDCLNKSVFNLI